MSKLAESLRERVKDFFETHDRKPAWLAKYSKVDPASVGRILKGEIDPALSTVEKFAGPMDLDPAYLFLSKAESELLESYRRRDRVDKGAPKVPPSPDSGQPDPVYERLIHAKSTLERPSDFLHLLDLFLDAPENIKAVVLALLANDKRIAEPYYSDFAARRAQLLKPE